MCKVKGVARSDNPLRVTRSSGGVVASRTANTFKNMTTPVSHFLSSYRDTRIQTTEDHVLTILKTEQDDIHFYCQLPSNSVLTTLLPFEGIIIHSAAL